ncbi:anti-sigma factor domain-containing protein [Humibacter sp. RRB41]|uniref:anti-sigma factor n=1 Tax=Humibacter sp. RRB41 TaxID=2919946 RepID=UPI001FAAE533|nr:anti-sigma factor [Humibacter sp. RRB41]
MSEQKDLRRDGAGDVRDLAAGYALGSLTPDERARYERLAHGSQDAAREREEFGDVAAALNAAPPTAEPSPDLKARLMEQIAITPQKAPSAVDRTDTAHAFDTPSSPDASPRTPAERRAGVRWSRRGVVIAAAAAAAVVIFAGGSIVGFNVSQHSVVSTQADALANITSAPDAQRATSTVRGGGTATLVWSESLDRSAMIVSGVKPAPAGRTYQLWYIRDGAATSAGLMSGEWQVLKGSLQKGDTIGLTVEPAGGSRQPTTEPVVTIVS